MQTWYFAPSLNHYRCIKAVTETGAVRVTDTFKFKHHALPTPSVTNTGRIVKATKDLTDAIKGNNKAPPDKLEAIENLKALIRGEPPKEESPNNETVEEEGRNEEEDEEQDNKEFQREEEPTLFQFQPVPTSEQPAEQPTIPIISQEDDDPSMPPPKYNLRSRALNIINSVIDPSLIPIIPMWAPVKRTTRGFWAANQALQIKDLQRKLIESPDQFFTNAIIDEDT